LLVHVPSSSTRHLARLVFVAFLLTFIGSRALVIIIIRRLPDLFLHLGETHVHHVNYGIFLLSTVAAVLLFAKMNETGCLRRRLRNWDGADL